ncbi:MAG: hypothetical protein ABH833_00245 [Parcubacteria group bacterium]
MPWSTNEIHDLLSGVANVFIALATLVLFVYILAPLFGGKFSFIALIYYGSWIGFSLCIKLEAKSIKDRKIGGNKFIIANIFELICLIIWFSFPYNLVAVVLFSFLKYFGFKELKKRVIT